MQIDKLLYELFDEKGKNWQDPFRIADLTENYLGTVHARALSNWQG